MSVAERLLPFAHVHRSAKMGLTGLTERRPLKNKWKPKGCCPLWNGKSTLSSRGHLHWGGALIAVLMVTRTRLTVCEVGVFYDS